jgi:hypothetical protein
MENVSPGWRLETVQIFIITFASLQVSIYSVGYADTCNTCMK